MGKILSVYWFAILVIVAGGIFAMVYIFYSKPYDVREIEANIFAQKVADCLSSEGKLKDEIGSFNFDDCHLNFEVETSFEDPQYYAKIEIFNVGDLDNSLFETIEGNKNFLASCKIQEDEEYKNLARCVEKRFYSVGIDNKQYLIKILSAVGKVEKNV